MDVSQERRLNHDVENSILMGEINDNIVNLVFKWVSNVNLFEFIFIRVYYGLLPTSYSKTQMLSFC